MTFSYKLTVQYDGTNFLGWQIQAKGRTIQGELNNCLVELAKSAEIRSLASGRTDTGVHALGQVVRVDLPIEIPVTGLQKGLNSLLPSDVKIVNCEKCDADFHPIAQAKRKTYRYYFTDGEIAPVFRNQIAQVKQGLDFAPIEQGAKSLVGKHDFQALHVEGSDPNSTIRRIYRCELKEVAPGGFQDAFTDSIYCLQISGNGFLKQMVRMIMGTLWSLGRGKIDQHQLSAALSGRLSYKLGPVAPAHGLFLYSVEY